MRHEARRNRSDAGHRVAFLFLGELHLVPHLLPIAAALARRPLPPAITCYVATSVHEEILRDAIRRLRLDAIAIRRVRGFRATPPGSTDTPRLPSKGLVLARNTPAFLREDVVVVAERTSLWVPRVFPRARFVYNEHGAGPHANFASSRNRSAARILMPGTGMAACARAAGPANAAIEVVGYIKRDFVRALTTRAAMPRFPEQRPTVLYMPHWKREKSSWWAVGEAVLDYFARSDRYNLILAPHVRLPRFDEAFARRVAPFRECSNIHIDATSFRLIDQTYTNGADIYLGDGSSQVIEFAERPRPAVFLNPEHIAWQSDPRFSHWTLGEVVSDIVGLDTALAAAPALHHRYADVQRAYVERMMGADDGLASERAADVVLSVLAERAPRRRRAPRAAFAH